MSGTATSARAASATLGLRARQLRHPLGQAVEDPRLDRRRDQRAPGAVLGLGAEVERDPLDPGALAEDHHQLGGPGDAVDPDLAEELALGLLRVGVAGAGDQIDRGDRLGADGEGGDRLRPAGRVDLVDPGLVAGGQHRGADVPLLPGGRGQGDPARPPRPGRGSRTSGRWRRGRRPRRGRRSRRSRPRSRGSPPCGPGEARPPPARRRAGSRPPGGCWRRRPPAPRGSSGSRVAEADWISSTGTLRLGGRTPSKRSPSSSTALSPPSRTAATICGDVGRHRGEAGRHPGAAGRPGRPGRRRPNRSW